MVVFFETRSRSTPRSGSCDLVQRDYSTIKISVAMISIELWRARIGAFNNKRPRSRCSVSSASTQAYVFFHWTRHRFRDISREEHSQLQAHISPLASPPPLSLPAEERSPAIETALPESSASSGDHGDLGGDSLSSSSLSSSSSMSLSPSFGELCFLHCSLLRDAFIMLVMAIISQLLIMAGDVETNPGPKHRGETLVGRSQTFATSETHTVL